MFAAKLVKSGNWNADDADLWMIANVFRLTASAGLTDKQELER
jgi:hypothetical protein